MRNSDLIKEKTISKDSQANGDRRQSVNEDVLKGLRLSGNDTSSDPKKMTKPPSHLLHKNTLMGDVQISNRNLNDSEIQSLKDELGKK